MEGISGGSFCFGTLYGFMAAGIIAMMANRMREARLKMEYKDRSYDRFPPNLRANLTASGVIRTSWQEWGVYTSLMVALIIFVGLALIGLFFIVL